MPRPSVIPSVKAALEDYLERMQVAFLAVLEEQRLPTLPATPDGKVNVRALAQAIELKQTQEKYLYERQKLTSLINLVVSQLDRGCIFARELSDGRPIRVNNYTQPLPGDTFHVRGLVDSYRDKFGKTVMQINSKHMHRVVKVGLRQSFFPLKDLHIQRSASHQSHLLFLKHI